MSKIPPAGAEAASAATDSAVDVDFQSCVSVFHKTVRQRELRTAAATEYVRWPIGGRNRGTGSPTMSSMADRPSRSSARARRGEIRRRSKWFIE